MSTLFQANDPTIESQWRAIILFGKNSATYKFAFANTLLEIVDSQKSKVKFGDLVEPFVNSMLEHIKKNDKQGNSVSSEFLKGCREYIAKKINIEQLYQITEKHAFTYVIDAFQIVNGQLIPDIFYEKNFQRGHKELILTDNLLKLKEQFQFKNLKQEVEARWNLVETAWNLQINPNLLEVKYDEDKSLFFIESHVNRRIDVTSVRASLNGYQKGKCFYSYQDISIDKKDKNLCEVDHFFPHTNKVAHAKAGANVDGVWNLVLADSAINAEKSAKIPEDRFLLRLYNRNEFYIESKHPLAETIVNQTGPTKDARRQFLQNQYDIAKNNLIHPWTPSIEWKGTF